MGHTLESFVDTYVESPVSQPMIFDISHNDEDVRLESLIASGKIHHCVDHYESQLKEYFVIQNPHLASDSEFEHEFEVYRDREITRLPLRQHGRWVYYPWLFTATHVLEHEKFHTVRTARNRYLITEEEQQQFYNATVGIAGLSVGNSVALAIALQGGARRMKLADHDQLELSNLNRIRGGVSQLGLPKVVLAARQIYELNPYAELELFSQGLTESNLEQFFDGLDVVVDEVDSLAVKYKVREHAQRARIPVVSGADVGDNAVISIERYDQNPELEFFHGFLGKVSYEELLALTKKQTGEYIARLIGHEHHTKRMFDSLSEIGHTLVSWPQLGGAAMLNGTTVAYCVRRIVSGQPIEEGRVFVSLDHIFMQSKPQRDHV